jgi:hypothetical protein
LYQWEPPTQLAQHLEEKKAKSDSDSEAIINQIPKALEKENLSNAENNKETKLMPPEKILSEKALHEEAEEKAIPQANEGSEYDSDSISENEPIETSNLLAKDESISGGSTEISEFSFTDNKLVEGTSYNYSINNLGTVGKTSFDTTIVADYDAHTNDKGDDALIDYTDVNEKLQQGAYSNAMKFSEGLQQQAIAPTIADEPSISANTISKKNKPLKSDRENSKVEGYSSVTVYDEKSDKESKNISYSWPYKDHYSSKAYILMEALSSISLSEINQAIKTKTIDLSNQNSNNLIYQINSSKDFVIKYPQMSPQWKYLIVFYDTSSKPIAYIALSEDEKTIKKYPEEAYSNSVDLIKLMKSFYNK